MEAVAIRSKFNLPPRLKVMPVGKSLTKQSESASCDINKIMSKYLKTGLISHGVQYAGEYGFADSVDFHSAMNTVRKAEQMFADLPAQARERFGNDPGSFLDFCGDEDNREEMFELGLMDPELVFVAPDPPDAPGGDVPPEAPSEAPNTVPS